MLIRKGKVKPYLPNITSKKKNQGKMKELVRANRREYQELIKLYLFTEEVTANSQVAYMKKEVHCTCCADNILNQS